MRTLRKKDKVLQENIHFFLRISISLVISLALFVSFVVFQGQKTEAQFVPDFSLHPTVQQNLSNTLISLSKDDIAKAQARKVVIEKQRAEAEKLRKEREDKVNRTIAFLRKQNSPVANAEIAGLIVDLSHENKADFRIVIAIMGTESGYCRASFYFNCFGYLNKVRYPSFKNAFQDLVPKISRQYIARYGWNFEALAKSYGQHNWQYGGAKMRSIANSI